jgi:hypothetical protein
MAELRPLGAGELLDRAVTIFVRQFVPIVVVVALTLVPTTILTALAEPHAGRLFSDLSTMIGAGNDPVAQRRAADELSGNTMAPWGFAATVVAMAVRLMMWSALLAVVAGAYAGAKVSVGQAYAIGARRWFAQIVVGLAFTVLGIVLMVPAVIAYLLLLGAVVALSALHFVAATIIVGVVFGVLVLTVFAVVASWVIMTSMLASVAVVTEAANPMTAIASAVRRSSARGMKRRTVVGGLVVFAISELGTLPILGLGVLLTSVTHVDALYYAVLGAGSVLLEGLVAAFVIVFATDVRVRREGIDILGPEMPVAVV